MNFTDEKDYIMRMIKEMVRVLFSLAFGKKYVSVELEKENKYEVSGNNLKIFLNMIDLGQINEAENILLDSIDYTNKNEVMAVALLRAMVVLIRAWSLKPSIWPSCSSFQPSLFSRITATAKGPAMTTPWVGVISPGAPLASACRQ